MTPTTFTWRFKLILKKHGLPTALNVHSLRHTNASIMINNGIPLTAVSGRLGHADTATTTRVYSHMIQSAQAAAADKIQDILSGYNHH